MWWFWLALGIVLGGLGACLVVYLYLVRVWPR